MSTISGEFQELHARGGKFLTYTGTHDQVSLAILLSAIPNPTLTVYLLKLVPAGNAKRAYTLALQSMGKRAMSAFYRLFLVPGMDHCGSPFSEGPFRIGHNAFSVPPVNDTEHNVLLALVDWVEGGRAPERVVGTGGEGEERVLCRHPLRSVWDGGRWVCKL